MTKYAEVRWSYPSITPYWYTKSLKSKSVMSAELKSPRLKSHLDSCMISTIDSSGYIVLLDIWEPTQKKIKYLYPKQQLEMYDLGWLLNSLLTCCLALKLALFDTVQWCRFWINIAVEFCERRWRASEMSVAPGPEVALRRHVYAAADGIPARFYRCLLTL